MAPTTDGGFKHGTAELWIVGLVSAILLAGATWFVKSASDASVRQQEAFAELRDRFIRIESKVESVHLALVDVPQLKLEQARMDLRIQYLESEKRAQVSAKRTANEDHP